MVIIAVLAIIGVVLIWVGFKLPLLNLDEMAETDPYLREHRGPTGKYTMPRGQYLKRYLQFGAIKVILVLLGVGCLFLMLRSCQAYKQPCEGLTGPALERCADQYEPPRPLR